MSSFIVEEGQFLQNSILLGIGITFVYDCLRIFRRVFPHHIFWVSLEDFFYWIFVSVSIFYLLYYENNGDFRWFAILGMLAGMILFEKTLSPLFVKYISRLMLWIKGIVGKILGFAAKPFVGAARAAGKKASAGKRKLRRMARILKKRLTVWYRTAKMVLCKRHKKAQEGQKG